MPGLVAASSSDGFSLPLVLAAGGVAILWLLATMVVWVIRRPPGVDAAAPTMELGAEPPAVAALLCDDYQVRTESAPSTLLDLAARGAISLEEVQPGETICVVRPGETGSDQLAPFEQHVLTALRAKAIDGVVPATALTTGTETASARWHRELARLVVADAQQRSLTVDRWSKRTVAVVGAGAVVVGALVGVAALIGGEAEAASGATVAALAVAIAGALAIGTAAGRMRRSLAQLPTPAGAASESRWLGVRAHLAQNEQLERLPPAAVKLYGRHLAYAAGFGLADHSVTALPFGEEDDHLAWSAHGGRWRRVRVRYPRVRPPGWGRHPAFITLIGLVGAAISGYLLVFLAGFDSNLALAAAAILAAPLLWSLWMLGASIPDLFTTRSVTGVVVRCRTRIRSTSSDLPKLWYYVAIDDGSRDRIAAYLVREEIYHRVRQGQSVVADVTPRLGYVRSLR